MARYTGPKSKKSRAFGQSIYGYDKAFERKKYAPGMHGNKGRRRRQKSDYAMQLMEKQKAKYTYGLLERQFRNLFEKANRKSGVTGEILFQMLESRLDNTVFRLGLAPTRRAARQLVSHKHIMVNGRLCNVPSMALAPGDVVSVRPKSAHMEIVNHSLANAGDLRKFPWIEWNAERGEGTFLELPEREQIPEQINEQLIVELYSK